MALSSSEARELLHPWVTQIFYKHLMMIAPVYPQFMNVETSVRAYEETFRVGGVGSFQLKVEGTPVSYDEPVVGDRKRTLNSTYALGIRIPMELTEDDQHGIVAQFPADLGDSGRDHQERIAHAPWNDAWAGATFTGMPEGDGTRRSLYNTGHVPMKAGGTQSNRAAPGVALTQTGLQDAITNLRLTQDEQGRQVQVQPAVLLIHPNNEWNAAELLESTTKPNTAEGTVNVVSASRLGLRVVSSPYLTDDDAFQVIAAKRQHSVKLYRRKGVTMNQGQDMDTFDSKYNAHWRGHATFDEWRGTYGSAPGT